MQFYFRLHIQYYMLKFFFCLYVILVKAITYFSASYFASVLTLLFTLSYVSLLLFCSEPCNCERRYALLWWLCCPQITSCGTQFREKFMTAYVLRNMSMFCSPLVAPYLLMDPCELLCIHLLKQLLWKCNLDCWKVMGWLLLRF